MELFKCLLVAVVVGALSYFAGCNAVQSCPTDVLICPANSTITTIDVNELKNNVRNYRDSVWSKTSKYFQDSSTPFQGNEDLLWEINQNSLPLIRPDSLDARFLDFGIDELKSYLCEIERVSTPSNPINTLRFYYIRYDETKGESVYSPPYSYFGMHSLAVVPVKKDSDGGSEEVYELGNGDPSILIPAANHHYICPPLTGCDLDASILPESDK